MSLNGDILYSFSINDIQTSSQQIMKSIKNELNSHLLILFHFAMLCGGIPALNMHLLLYRTIRRQQN